MRRKAKRNFITLLFLLAIALGLIEAIRRKFKNDFLLLIYPAFILFLLTLAIATISKKHYRT